MAATEVIRFPFSTQATHGVCTLINLRPLDQSNIPLRPFNSRIRRLRLRHSPVLPAVVCFGASLTLEPRISLGGKGRPLCKRPLCTKQFS
jgi:hypothetical protein